MVKKKKELCCKKCPALCCQYFALEIDEPTCKKDFENIRWFLVHEKTKVMIDNGDWFIEIQNKCEYLSDTSGCMIYDKRPAICREYGWHEEEDYINCTYHLDDEPDYDRVFHNLDELDAYIEELKVKKKTKKNK